MVITIQDYKLPNETHKIYDVKIYGDVIHTLVTHEPTLVSQWLNKIQSLNHYQTRRLIVGLDVEWRPNDLDCQNNPVATLQLCVGFRCLIYLLIHSPYFPPALVNFLSDQNCTFVGVGIESDLEKLEAHYGFGKDANFVDLRKLAADAYQMREVEKAGLKTLARIVLGKDMEKSKTVSWSRWDNRWLSPDQVQYACVDAFVSYEIGRVLTGAEHPVFMAQAEFGLGLKIFLIIFLFLFYLIPIYQAGYSPALNP